MERLTALVDQLHEKALADAVSEVQTRHQAERKNLMTKIHELKEAKISLEGQLEEEKRKVSDLFIDAEHLRSELHKEIKDYRKMKKNLKSIILEF